MKRKQKNRNEVHYCPYCGSRTEFRSADGIYRDNSRGEMLYVCKRYPACDSYVRVYPGTMEPMGTIANKQLRRMRKEAHHYFDQLYTRNFMSRREAYLWLSEMLGLPVDQTHIGLMGEYNCQCVIDEAKKMLDGHSVKKRNKRKIKWEGDRAYESHTGAARDR